MLHVYFGINLCEWLREVLLAMWRHVKAFWGRRDYQTHKLWLIAGTTSAHISGQEEETFSSLSWCDEWSPPTSQPPSEPPRVNPRALDGRPLSRRYEIDGIWAIYICTTPLIMKKIMQLHSVLYITSYGYALFFFWINPLFPNIRIECPFKFWAICPPETGSNVMEHWHADLFSCWGTTAVDGCLHIRKQRLLGRMLFAGCP